MENTEHSKYGDFNEHPIVYSVAIGAAIGVLSISILPAVLTKLRLPEYIIGSVSASVFIAPPILGALIGVCYSLYQKTGTSKPNDTVKNNT